MTSGGADAPPDEDFSVVLAVDGAVDQLPNCLSALGRACAGLSARVIVVHPGDVHVTLPADAGIATTLVAVKSRLVPMLWGRGIAVSRGRVVALSTTQFQVADDWARALLAAFSTSGYAAVGGRMALPREAGALEKAVFLIRYSEHMGTSDKEAPREIAGDNAAYLRDAAVRCTPNLDDGFWEVDVHRLLRADGLTIGRAAGAVAEFHPALSMREMVVNRFVHGSHFGAYRVRALGWSRWRALAVTPLVPGVLFARILGRMRRAGQPIGGALALMPQLLILLTAWAAGEAVGALDQGHATSG